jgi:hypothetical protein
MIYTPEIGKHAALLRQRGYEDLLDKRLVFTISTGRAGTQTLSAVFGCARKTCSLHEPKPGYSKCLRRVQRNAEAALEFLVEQKLPAIRAPDEPCYVETSHVLCKGFIEPLLELGLRPHFVIVHRDPRAVARSFVELNSIPERTPLGRDFMLSPADPCLLEAPGWQDFTDYQLCYWYALESRQRAQWYAALFDRIGIHYTRFEFADLADPVAVGRLIWACGLEIDESAHARIAQILAEPMNAKIQDKLNVGRHEEVADSSGLQHDEFVVARTCKASATDDYLPRLRVTRAKAA